MVINTTLQRLLNYLTPSKSLICGWLCLSCLACAGPSVLERDYGQSWAYNQAVQIVNPTAGFTSPPATGLAPKAGANVMEAYEKSFERKEAGGGSTTINLSPMTTGSGK